MRDYIWQRMENDQGELADVVRSGGWVGASSTAFSASDWQLPSEPVVFPPASIKDSSSYLGDPFTKVCDPLIDELSGIEFFKSRETMAGQVKMVIKGSDCGDGGRFIAQKLLMGGETKKPFDIISPEGDKSSPHSPVMSGEMMKLLIRFYHLRGYYRCSSSKGCSARKQVERSRTDPNMLVITYTYEHNHPWPAQRNAHAGFTRSQTSKHYSTRNLKETTRRSAPSVKQEVREVADKANDQAFHRRHDEHLISQQDHPDNFFTDMSVLEVDTMNLIFSKELTETKPEEHGDKALDPFSMFY
ncbi:hypothetical protein BHE74_00007809 [Ensete ventricosum]|nr:hypothetical protein GW17_00014509 [Ensete ventricosum]RWW83674.1 hypothetical protein BHE74_00007809 [Ensete ventricosum]